MRSSIVTLVMTAAPLGAVVAWNGTDADTGGPVEIGKGNLVRPGSAIEVYDSEVSAYRSVTVESVDRTGTAVRVQVFDPESGRSRTLEMDGR